MRQNWRHWTRCWLWRVVVAILRLAAETQALAADQTLNEPFRGHQRDFLWCHTFLHQWWTGVVCHHGVVLSSRNVCRQKNGLSSGPCFHSARYLKVVTSLPEQSLSSWSCRTDEAPPIVISWAQSAAGFSNTRRTRRDLKGLQRGCLEGEKQVFKTDVTLNSVKLLKITQSCYVSLKYLVCFFLGFNLLFFNSWIFCFRFLLNLKHDTWFKLLLLNKLHWLLLL